METLEYDKRARARHGVWKGGAEMTAVYFDKYGRMSTSGGCNVPKTPRSNRSKCGAKTRKGTPCIASSVWDEKNDKVRNGRCKLHGGLSTGPKTEAGKEAIRISNQKRRSLPSSLSALND